MERIPIFISYSGGNSKPDEPICIVNSWRLFLNIWNEAEE